jgi:hypothetical protein
MGKCDYCGSLHPDEFMARIKAGENIGPTDKSYKAYVGNMEKFYFQHLSEAQKREFVALLNSKSLKIGFPGHFYTLPYFIA